MAEPDPSAVDSGKGEVAADEPLTWMTAWARANQELRLSDEQWLDITPRQCAALQAARMRQVRREELMMGVLAATTQNFSACHPERPVAAESFMFHPFPKKKPEPITAEYISRQFDAARKRGANV